MQLTRYNPWPEMNSLQRRFNHLLDDLALPTLGEDWDDFPKFARVPPAELTETKEALLLCQS